MKLFENQWSLKEIMSQVEAKLFRDYHKFNKLVCIMFGVWHSLGPANAKDYLERIRDYQAKYFPLPMWCSDDRPFGKLSSKSSSVEL